MLFRRFMLVTTTITIMAIGLLNLLDATRPNRGEFQAGTRLKQWEKHETEQACKADPKKCALIITTLNQA